MVHILKWEFRDVTAPHSPPLHSPLTLLFPLPTESDNRHWCRHHRPPDPLPCPVAPLPPSDPIKGRGVHLSSPHSSPPTFPTLRAPSRPSSSFTTAGLASPSNRPSKPSVSTPRSSSPFSPIRGELPGSAAPASHAPVSVPPGPDCGSTVDRPPLCGPQPVDSVHHFFFVKINQNLD
jgi:hypothetical protein